MSEYIIIPLSKTGKYKGKYETVVSVEDADLAELNWSVCAGKYAQRRPNKYTPLSSLHRVIMERILGRPLEKLEGVDHINNNGLDNRRENLRLAVNSQNHANVKLRKDNTSGFKGVTYNRQSGRKWIARIQYNGKMISIGRFDTPEQAHAAYREKAKELFGEYANDGRRNLKDIEVEKAPKPQKKIDSRNKSGFTGVYFRKRVGTYVAYITENGKRKYLGSAKTAAEANEIIKRHENES